MYLNEWILFHLLQGVERFYLYNNLSEDGYMMVLKKYIEEGVVILIDWPPKDGKYSTTNCDTEYFILNPEEV